jgi:CDP-diacylglycerol--glycerol-3-phosphate 3-phosphatidyltransferase
MNLANKITIFRIILVPIILIIPFFNIPGDVWGVPLSFVIIDVIFVIASLTDKLDGYIARSRNQITNLGKFLDPIADKILVIVAMLILVEAGKLPAWIPAIVVIREFIVSGYRLIAVEKQGKVIAASVWGKIKTCTQMLGLTIAFLDVHSFGAIFTENLTGGAYVLNLATTLLLGISVIATIFSGIDYLKGCKEIFKEEK